MEAKSPSHIDLHVGRRLYARRRELKLSQEALANRVGLTFQQVQKYERGTNRISAGRLYEFAKALETTITYFFSGMDELDAAARTGVAEEEGAYIAAFDTDAHDLFIAYRKIADPAERKQILKRTRDSAASAGDAPKLH